MAVSIEEFNPAPGRNLRRYLVINVQRAGRDDTAIADALQRYLNVKSKYNPEIDLRDVDSHETFPTLVMAEDEAWGNLSPYEFYLNGVLNHNLEPNFYAQTGALKIELKGRGGTSITTPPTGPEPFITVGPSMSPGYPPAWAAELTMRRLTELLEPTTPQEIEAEKARRVPLLTNHYYPPAAAAQLAMRRLSELIDLEEPSVKPLGTSETKSSFNILKSLTDYIEGQSTGQAPEITGQVNTGLNNLANMGLYSKAPALFLTVLNQNRSSV
jgi:hypothetical protein